MQGDIVAVYNSAGKKIGSYAYDAWGNMITTVTSGVTALVQNVVRYYNPFRYRGYFYDTETGYYYLQSRYYNPTWGRFLNADKFINANLNILGYNTFTYCGNNPIMGYDKTGEKTTAVGLSFSFALFGSGYSFSIALATDDNDMVAIQWSYSVPNNDETRNTELGVNIGASFFIQQTDLESVSDLEGKSKSAGVSVGALSGDAITDSSNNHIGYQIGVGIGVSYSVHVNETYTRTIGSPFKSLIKWLMDLW